MACEYNYKDKWYTEDELLQHPDFYHVPERDMINDNTGPKNDSLINLFNPSDGNHDAGVYTKFIQFKESQLNEYSRRLSEVQRKQRAKNVSVEELTRLNNLERELKLQVEGKHELGVKGLKVEIAELKKSGDIKAVGYYANKDIERLSKLAKSTNVDDLNEAQRLIDFYSIAGTFERGIKNPFFSQNEIFLKDENDKLSTNIGLPDETVKQFKDWADTTGAFQSIINKRGEEVLTDTVNNDPSIKKTYGLGRKFSYNELLKSDSGLKDVDWVSMWTMDITNGIFSNNGLIPQVMFSYLVNSFEKKKAWARHIEEKIDKMNPGVQKELMRLGHTLRGGGIMGLKGASYNIFKEYTKEGNDTGGLIQRFNKEYFDSQSKQMNKFHDAFDSARSASNYTSKLASFNKAFEELKKWRRENTIILDSSKIPELSSSNPESEAYKKSLVNILGSKGYKEHVDKQQQLNHKYEAERQSTIDTILIEEGKGPGDTISDKGKEALKYWENNHAPDNGVKDYNSSKGLFIDDKRVNNFMDYNILVPREFIAETSIDNEGNYNFKDTDKLTNHYSTTFKTIEDNPILSEFHDTMKEVIDNIRENTPYELQEGMAVNSIPALRKSFAEMIGDKNTGILQTLFPAFQHLVEKMRLAFGVVKQSTISHATIDPITGKANYKVNDQFLAHNKRDITDRMAIEKSKFLQALNINRKDKINDIKRFSVLALKSMSPAALMHLSDYINVPLTIADASSGRIDSIRRVTGDNVDIGKYIRDYSINQSVQANSFDLGKIAKYYSNLTMMYAARQEALPILEIMKKHYEEMKKPKTNNLGASIYNANDKSYEMMGLRTNAIKQMDDWFERVALDNYGGKQAGVHGMNVKDITDNEGNIKTQIPFYGNKIFSNEEKGKIKEINSLLKGETNEQTKAKLIKIKEGLGKERTATAAIDNLFNWIRTLRLGYNLSSASTNFMEGVQSNVMLAASGQYFDPKEIYYGYNVVKHSFLKNISFGHIETALAKKNRSLMDKFDVVMDSKNELQKSSVRTYASNLSGLNPHDLNQRVEYINQSPVMIAMLRTLKIDGKDGNKSSVWDALDKHGHLLDNFQTEKNTENWEDLNGEDYLNFKQNLHKAIVLGHGNYDELRGMMIKTGSAGKALMMFKTWIPMQLYWRFASEHDDIQTGQQGVKGNYWSYSKGTAAIHGAAAGAAFFGPLGAAIGYGAGYGLGAAFGVDAGVGVLQQSLESLKVLGKKMLGMPVNLIAGKELIKSGDKAFESWIGKGGFTAQDAKNMRTNMADVAMQLAWIASMLIAKAMFWDDQDKPDDKERIAHNILINKLMQLSSQASSYVNPVDTYKSVIQSNGVWQWMQEVGKEIHKTSEWLHGRDIIQSGYNSGQSGLAIQSSKLIMPGIFKGNLFGFGTMASRVFEESPFHPYFQSEASKEKSHVKRERAEYHYELEKELKASDLYQKETDDEKKEEEKRVKKELNERFPSNKKLDQLGMTRKEYEKQNQPQ